MNNPLAILIVDEDDQQYAQIAALLHRCYNPLPLLQRLSNDTEALQVMTAQRHDLYLLSCATNHGARALLAKQSLTQGCLGPIIFMQPQGAQTFAADTFEAGVTAQLFLKDLTPTLLRHTIQDALTRALMQKQMRKKQTSLMDSREQERARLSHRLHEGPLQDLIGMRFYLGIASDVVDSAEAKEQLAFVQQNLQSVIDGLRSFCVELRPPALGPFGLEKAIRAEVGRFRHRYPDLEVISQLDSDALLLSTRVRLALYRIFQQALLNIAQHAEATRVVVHLTLNKSTVHLAIQDNGRGFTLPESWAAFANEGRFGLFEARERALNVDGHFHVQSVAAPNPATGTTLSITVPI